MIDADASRRARIFYATPDFVLSLFDVGTPQKLYDGSLVYRLPRLTNLPSDARVTGVQYDFTRHAFAFRIEHPSFDPVAPGHVCPTMEVYIRTVEIPAHTPPDDGANGLS